MIPFKLNKKNHRRGANLVEASLFGLIAVGLISAAYVTYSTVSESNKAQATAQQFTKIHGIIKEAHSSASTYGGGNLASFLQNHGFPLNEVSSAPTPVLKSPTGSALFVQGEINNFIVEYKLLKSKPECEAILKTAFKVDGVYQVFMMKTNHTEASVTPAIMNKMCNDNTELATGIKIYSN